ncbi:MAG TPA: peptide chain release factor N(5)-glutamine methyltransferase [Candidatus Udaeobacter sp.]|jgi:release factor glutamine methyltransferase|nr:peptide chain release factor N(5)-glutamine methyltransferase [Candidatus Udaeobacter sp.]
MSPTVSGVLRDAIAVLAAADTARSDSEELLSRLLRLTLPELRASGSRMLSSEEAPQFQAWLSRRAAGEPVQYITGRAAFRDLDLAVDRRVLIPRPETEGLVEAVLEALRAETQRWPSPRVVDLGCGSGAIALAIASEYPAAVVTATDWSSDALELARENANSLGLAPRINFRHGDWFDAVDADERFEVVVANPPYIATGEWDALPNDVRAFEPHQALFSGSSGLDALREIIDEAPRHLVAGGLLALELPESRAAEVAGWLEGAHDWEGVELREDLSGAPRVLLARRARGPAIAPQQWPEEMPDAE